MKKLAIFLLLIVCSFSFLVGCKDKEEDTEFYKYFNNFTSRGEFNQAVKVLSLRENCFFESYDYESGVFTIKELMNPDREQGEEEIYFYGFATQNEELIKPIYMGVIEIKGEFAIVVKPIGENNKIKLKIGLVKIRGNGRGKEYGFKLEYLEQGLQYQFLNEKYIAITGGIESSVNKDFSVIYDYNNDYGVLEVGQIVTNGYFAIQLFDNYLTVLDEDSNEIRYYDFKKIDNDGRYRLVSSYKPFPKEEYPEDTYTSYNITLSNEYLGNGWFLRSGTYSSTKEYSGYHFTQTADSKTNYIMINSERYNVFSGNILLADKPAFVANKYSSKLFRAYADVNNSAPPSINKLPVYITPSLPVSELIKDNYSLVYYYYAVGESREAQISFAVYDNKGNSINLRSLIYPLLFVDKNAIQLAEPDLSTVFGNLESRDYFDNVKVYEKAETGKTSFDTSLIFGGGVYGSKLSYTDKDIVSDMGAYDVNGNILVPFKYFELSPFFGEYAIGSYFKDNENTRTFVRINKNGEESLLDNVYFIKNGVYITKENEEFKLYSNSGKILIDNGCKLISPLEIFLSDGNFIKTIVSTNENNRGHLYILE